MMIMCRIQDNPSVFSELWLPGIRNGKDHLLERIDAGSSVTPLRLSLGRQIPVTALGRNCKWVAHPHTRVVRAYFLAKFL